MTAEERLISREAQQELLLSGTLPVAVDTDFERFIAGRRALLDARLAAVDAKAKDGLVPDVSLEKGVLKKKSTPPASEAPAARIYAILPRIRITDLLSEVARWTLFTDCFAHLRSGETVTDPRILMAGLLADGLEDPELRSDTGRELNKGESRNSLALAVFIHRLVEIRDRTYETSSIAPPGSTSSSPPSPCGTPVI